MAQQFINYNAQQDELFIATYRIPGGFFNHDALGLAADVLIGCSGSCPLSGAKGMLEKYREELGALKGAKAMERILSLIKSHNLEED